MTDKMRIDVWSDVVCPWCYVGKRRLEAALAKFEHASDVDVVWHAFELDPGAPRERDASVPHVERIAKKYGISVERARAMHQHLTDAAAAEGLPFDFEHIRSGNTFDAHRLIELAREHGLQDQVKERFMRAYFCEGQAIGEQATLQRLATEAGLPADAVSDLLASDHYATETRADEADAQRLGISGVPFFVLDNRYGISGAQPAELLLKALEQAWSERPTELRKPAAASQDGAVCGPDGCD